MLFKVNMSRNIHIFLFSTERCPCSVPGDLFSTSNQKQLFTFVDKIFNVKSTSTLPKHDFLETIVESFGEFFEGQSLSEQPVPRINVDLTAKPCPSPLTRFQRISKNGLKTEILLSWFPPYLASKELHWCPFTIMISIMNMSVDQLRHLPFGIQEVTRLAYY